MVAVEVKFLMKNGDDYQPIFPVELETSTNVLFHGTNAAYFENIQLRGLVPKRNLDSISYARTSALALSYACGSRSSEQPKGIILAFEFDVADFSNLRHERDVVYSDPHGPKGKLVAYCYVPADYKFV